MASALTVRGSRLVAAALVLLASVAARAEVLRFEFTGEIESTFGVIGATPASAFDGAPFAGYTHFDSTTPDAFPASPNDGIYPMEIPPGAFHAQVGGAAFDAPVFEFAIANDSTVFSGADLMSIQAMQAFDYPGVAGEHVTVFSITLFDTAGAVFTSAALPTVPPDLAAFADPAESRSFSIQGCGDANFSGGSCASFDFILTGDLVSFTLPEASGAGVAGALSLAALARRRARFRRCSTNP